MFIKNNTVIITVFAYYSVVAIVSFSASPIVF